MKASFTFLAALTIAGCATDADSVEDHRMVSYECGQVVVVGRIATMGSQLVDANDDGIAWSSLSTASIHVTRSLAGSRKGAVLPVDYVSHGQLRDDIDFMFVLAPHPNGKSHGLVGATLMETRPQLVQPCNPPSSPDASEGGPHTQASTFTPP